MMHHFPYPNTYHRCDRKRKTDRVDNIHAAACHCISSIYKFLDEIAAQFAYGNTGNFRPPRTRPDRSILQPTLLMDTVLNWNMIK
jgi:hypothetical protein